MPGQITGLQSAQKTACFREPTLRRTARQCSEPQENPVDSSAFKLRKLSRSGIGRLLGFCCFAAGGMQQRFASNIARWIKHMLNTAHSGYNPASNDTATTSNYGHGHKIAKPTLWKERGLTGWAAVPPERANPAAAVAASNGHIGLSRSLHSKTGVRTSDLIVTLVLG